MSKKPGVATWVQELTEEVMGPAPVEIGKKYMHPQHGPITIISGQYWGKHGLSNFWYWEDAHGIEHNGYGEPWPEIKENE